MNDRETAHWYVMRDLKRANARQHAYEQLAELGFYVFTPKVRKVVVRQGRKESVEEPYIPSLLFVKCSRACLDPVVERIPTLQYQWLRHQWRMPMTVPDTDMDRFIRAVSATLSPRYYLPSEITPRMCDRPVRIIGGPLDGQEGTLITTRGSKVKRLLVSLPGLLAAGVEVDCEFIQFVGNE